MKHFDDVNDYEFVSQILLWWLSKFMWGEAEKFVVRIRNGKNTRV